MNSPAEIIEKAIEIINGSKELALEIGIAAKDTPSVSRKISISTEGIHKAKTNKEDLVVEVDFPGDESNNPEFVNMLKEMTDFYNNNSQYLLVTTMKFKTDDGSEIATTVDTFTPFPKFCSFRVACEDIEIS